MMKLHTALQTLGHTQALKDGSIRPQTFEFEFEEVAQIIQAMAAEGGFDIRIEQMESSAMVAATRAVSATACSSALLRTSGRVTPATNPTSTSISSAAASSSLARRPRTVRYG